MRLSAMGDVALAVPVLEAFTTRYPDVQVTMVSRPFFRPLFENIPQVSFFEFDGKSRHKGFRGLLRLYRDLRSREVDTFADFHNVLRSKVVRLLYRLSGHKTAVIDKGRAEKKALTSPVKTNFRMLRHASERYADVLRDLGFALELPAVVQNHPTAISPEILEVSGSKSGTWIGIAPFAQHQGKVYPLDLMEKAIQSLSTQPGYKIFLFGGGKQEKEALSRLAGNAENILNTAGKLSFSNELQLISQLDLMISMDSGNGHLAAIMGVPVLTLWGATHPFAGFLPFGQPIENALMADRHRYPKLPTSVYGNKIVEGYEDAMKTITPEAVVSKALSMLHSK